ncbi:unnamed protein product [Pocillopora meandrina]|uniref:Uncharacterized protein n=1 Tax=Pocillopora meandrina TaxID=46732 RepID=A0AAU9Y148_9CNID|nr:unnamed protein product [Pocillopora meandrina]
MANGIEPKPVEHVRPPRVPSYQEQSMMRNFHAAAIGKEPNSTKPPCSLYQKTGPITMLPHADDGKRPDVPREGALAVTLTSCNAETPT